MATKTSVSVSRLHKLDGAGAIKAFCDVAFNDEIVIKGFKIVEGKDGLFVSMPCEAGKDGKRYNIVTALTREMKDAIELAVLEIYGG